MAIDMEDDYEPIRRRLLQRQQLRALEEAPAELDPTIEQIAPIVGQGLDLASKLSAYDLTPAQISTGINIPAPPMTNAAAQVQSIINDRKTRVRQAALDETNMLKAIEDIRRRKAESAAMADYRRTQLAFMREKGLADIELRGLALGQSAQKIAQQQKQFDDALTAKTQMFERGLEHKTGERLGGEQFKAATREDEQAFKSKESEEERALRERLAKEAEKAKSARSASGGGKNQVPGMVYFGEYTPTEKDATEIKKKKAAWEDLDNSINRLSQAVNKYDLRVMPGAEKSELSSAYRDVQIKAKEAAALGAITGPDMDIITGQIPDPTSLTSSLSLDKKTLSTILQNQRKRAYDSFNNQSSAYGYKLKSPVDIKLSDVGDAAKTVVVVSPTGKRGTIPVENLDKALKRGYKKVQ